MKDVYYCKTESVTCVQQMHEQASHHMNRCCISRYGVSGYCRYIHDTHRHSISGHGTVSHGGSGA